MNPVQRRYALASQELRRGDIGRDHAFLDQLVRVIALIGLDPLDLALFAKGDLDLVLTEIQRTALAPRLRHHLIERVEMLHMRQHGSQSLARGRLARTDRIPDLVIGQARCRADHCPVEATARGLAAVIDAQLGHHGQPVDLGLQRAQLVAECLGQHRHHPLREVDRGATQLRFGIQRAAGLHVVRNVGDGDQQSIAGAFRFAPDGVVKVAGILAIDGDQRHFAQIDPIAFVGGSDPSRDAGRLGQQGFGPFSRNAVGLDGQFHCQSGSDGIAEYAHDPTDRLAVH